MVSTYTCGQCNHAGSAIWEQVVKVGILWHRGLSRETWQKLTGMGAKILYACWSCGMEVKAG